LLFLKYINIILPPFLYGGRERNRKRKERGRREGKKNKLVVVGKILDVFLTFPFCFLHLIFSSFGKARIL